MADEGIASIEKELKQSKKFVKKKTVIVNKEQTKLGEEKSQTRNKQEI